MQSLVYSQHKINLSVFINIDKGLVAGHFVDDMIIAAKTLDAVEEFKMSFSLIC